jgi:hypothetical protein
VSTVERSVEERLSAYLDGELAAAERAEVERALESSPELRRHLAELKALDALARELPEDVAAPEGYFEALAGRVRSQLPRRARRVLAPPWVWAAAAAVVIAAAIPLVESPVEPPEPPAPTAPAAGADSPAVAPDDAAESFADAPPAPPVAEPPEAEPGPASERADPGAAAGAARPVSRSAPPGQAIPSARGPAPGVATQRVESVVSQPTPRVEGTEDASAQPEQKALTWEETRPAEGAPARVERVREELALRRERAGPRPGPQGAAPAAAPVRSAAAAGDASGFDQLAGRSASTPEEARALREEWRAFADAHPESEEGAEARVRVVEAGTLAYRLGGDPADLELARRDAAPLLEGSDADAAERVRGLLAEVE